MIDDRIEAQRIADELQESVARAGELAEKLGLTPYPVNYWIVDYDEMNELIAYGGFQRRYPHWRWGMAYDRQRKQNQFLGGKAFEIVNNDNPAHAFLQESNSLADQKAVITHVEAHADFFANNEWFGLFTDRETGDTIDAQNPAAAEMLARHAETIREYMRDPEIDRSEVERWIDHVLCLEDTIDQHRPYAPAVADGEANLDIADPAERLDELDLSEEVTQQVFGDEWLDAQAEDVTHSFPVSPEKDVLGFIRKHGKRYDESAGKAVEMTDWQKDVLEIVRREAYYFAPQKMTKVLNEGWATYWESVMMVGEGFADADEFVTYADHMSKVLGSGGLNPYKLGFELWQYVENVANRREVVERLLRVEGITWRNFHEAVDFGTVLSTLAPPAWIEDVPGHLGEIDSDDPRVDADALERARDGEIDVEAYPWTVLSQEGLVRRHYSLVKPQHRGFLARIGQAQLEQISRYLFDDSRYDSVDAALADVEYARGWDRMREIRQSHNDVTFLDEFLTDEFVEEHDYFAYEYSQSAGDFRVSSTDPEDVKQKLLLQFTNFGKPTIVVEDGNYGNAGELLLAHRYNGIALDIEQATDVLERAFDLWGRPVNLLTIDKDYDDSEIEVARRQNREPDPVEIGRQLRYDGQQVTIEDVPWEMVEHLAATDVDYDTRPEEWLS
ncbi:SpoVR family protein [Halapricum hydrolyticum]|uniref:SpoVR family protein n=1 Tax=Halapricum hydrolyticum TaxID=2979991 RepID=A0AAE3I924_9EURY|nr:SpoVR family protein [Halapricum hydrolyticum]MCU4716823.1 SpoVR family protein [Halapricum hydrolyticum]MCU4725572.1 SpoVR family protein [Halapricum hydrolyticum]